MRSNVLQWFERTVLVSLQMIREERKRETKKKNNLIE